MKTINVEGIDTECEEVEPLHTNENWSTWQMLNGDVIKAKLIATRIFYAHGAKNKGGDPVYECEFKTVFRVIGTEK